MNKTEFINFIHFRTKFWKRLLYFLNIVGVLLFLSVCGTMIFYQYKIFKVITELEKKQARMSDFLERPVAVRYIPRGAKHVQEDSAK